MSEYYTINEMYGEKFFQVPKVFFTNPKYKDGLNDREKIAFGMLKNRCNITCKNKWFKVQGRIYFLYSRDKLADIFGCSLKTATNVRKSLEKVGLLEIKRRGQGYSDMLYLKKPDVTEEDIYKIDKQEQPEEPENKTPETVGGVEKGKSYTSRGAEVTPQEVYNLPPSNTELKELELKDIDDDDYIINAIEKNPVYVSLARNLFMNGVPKTIIIKIVGESIKQNLQEFSTNDAVEQLKFMTEEYNDGKRFTDYHIYFVNGLMRRTEQRKISDFV